MILWITILIALIILTSAAILYVSKSVYSIAAEIRSNAGIFFQTGKYSRSWRGLSILAVLAVFSLLSLCLHIINAVVVFLHLAVFLILSDLIFYIFRRNLPSGYVKRLSAIAACAATLCALSAGWYLNHNVWRTEYSLTTSKEIEPLRIVMFADSHIGTTFNAAGFEKHLKNMEKDRPDLIIIAGDFVDDSTTKDDMLGSVRALGKIRTKYGIYFAVGNHDKGYYGDLRRGYSLAEMTDEMRRNGITVLTDEISDLPANITVIGRKDLSVERELQGSRYSAAQLRALVPEDRYAIVIDHQPSDFNRLADSRFDLVLGGHTHGGQMFPLNSIGKLTGVLDLVYGYERRGTTDFIVTSGISDWALKFKTGTFSEYTVININRK